MLTLMLLRHAKSDWSGAGVPDFERGLTPRGQRAGLAMGLFMAKRKLLPELVLCSPARRAVATWELLGPHLNPAPQLVMDKALYDFGDGGNLLKLLRLRGGHAGSVLIVAHNPALQELARCLVGVGDKPLREALEQKYPTAALAVITLPASDWSLAEEGTGTLVEFIRPRDIMVDAGD